MDYNLTDIEKELVDLFGNDFNLDNMKNNADYEHLNNKINNGIELTDQEKRKYNDLKNKIENH